MTVLQSGQKHRAIFPIGAPAQEVPSHSSWNLYLQKPGSSSQTSSGTSPVVSPTPLQCQSTLNLPGPGTSWSAATRTTWKFTGVTTKSITWFPAATLPLPSATVISLPAGFLAPEGDQQTIWSLQGGWLAARVFSPSPTWLTLGCVQRLMTVWQDSSVTLRRFAKAKGQWVWWNPSEEPLCSHQQGPTPSSGTAVGTLHV